MTESYDRRRERERIRNREQASAGKDIGRIPARQNRPRHKRCRLDFKSFCLTYFPAKFPWPFSADHLYVIEEMQQAVLSEGLFAVAMPRASGKTTLCERAVLWAILYGHRKYVMLVCADEDMATKRLKTLKKEFETNPLLLADFPRAVYPIRKLERMASRCAGQTYRKKPTYIEWTAKGIVLPFIPRSCSAGAVVEVGGITSAIVGALHTQPDGSSIRPDLVFLDDPQTRESAFSQSQCKTREDIISADVLGMAGPGKSMSALCTLTVKRRGDMADRLVDRDIHPRWNGYRSRMITAWPTNMDAWHEYNLLSGEFRTAFYAEHREEMDEGGGVSWEHRKADSDLSALQHAMDLFFRSPEAFASEYQNEPIEMVDDDDVLTVDQIVKKLTGNKRGEVPESCTTMSAFVDVHKNALYWVVMAWEPGFTGYVIDYGTYPEQPRNYFTLLDVRRTLSEAAPGAGMEGSIYAGLKVLSDVIMTRDWPRSDGSTLRIGRCLVDANWGQSTDTVYKFVMDSPFAANITPSHGKYIGAKSIALCDPGKRAQRGEQLGEEWKLRSGRSKIRHVVYDTNHWKTQFQTRLSTAIGDRGSISLFGQTLGGDPVTDGTHRMMAEHLWSQFCVRTEGRGRKVNEFSLRPELSEDHFLDCVVGCCVGASMQGICLDSTAGLVETLRRPKHHTDLAGARRRHRQSEARR